MHPDQNVSGMLDEPLVRQARARAQRTGEPIEEAHAAETPEQIKAAKPTLDRWLSRNPGDFVTRNKREYPTITEAWMRIKGEWR